MRVFVFVNRIQEIGFRQTTALLIAAFFRQGFEVFLSSVNGLSVSSKSESDQAESTSEGKVGQAVFANSVRFQRSGLDISSQHVANFASEVADSQLGNMKLEQQDLIFIRTNPGRDLANSSQHNTFLELCQVAQACGIRVVNDPARLSFFASKAAISLLPSEYRPEMLVTQNFATVREFIEDANRDCVVKPLLGSRGNNVIRLNSSSEIDVELARFEQRTVVVQHFVDSDEPGDKRVVVLNGKLLQHKGHFAGIHRVPADGDFRANLHAGGSAKPLSLNPTQQDAALAAAKMLQDAGIHLAGIDLIDSKVIEFNVFSTGGLYDAFQFSSHDFTDQITKILER